MYISDTDDGGVVAETVVGILAIGAVIGTMQAGNLTTKRRNLIDYVLGMTYIDGELSDDVGTKLENVLDNLCEKGLIQYTDAIIGGPHYLLY